MSNAPSRALGEIPVLSGSRQTSRPQQSLFTQMPGPSSASSSITAAYQPSRADQVIYRVYVKTVGVLVEGRLTHYGNVNKTGERKKDKWVSRRFSA